MLPSDHVPVPVDDPVKHSLAARARSAGAADSRRQDTLRLAGARRGPVLGCRRPVLIIGVPRSGTTWLGKIFDSHPQVVYRHEPDDVLRQQDFPGICPAEDIPRYIDPVRGYVAALTRVRQVKASGTRPIFPKPFQSAGARLARQALALTLRAAEAVPLAAPLAKRIPIPDFITIDDAAITYVIKSVSLIGAAALLATALPEGRIIVVFRHPCGQIASIKRAVASGLTRGGLFGPRVLATPGARALGMTREQYDGLPPIDRWAWAWAFVHEKLFAETKDLPNVRLVSYERVCEAPAVRMQELIAFAGLPLAPETDRFIERTTRSSGPGSYFGLFRDPLEAATKWKRELSASEIDNIIGIVERVLPGLAAV